MNFVSNIIWNSVEGFVEAGTRTAGGYAGDALIKAGDLIENSGRGLGNRIERTASGYGTRISGQGYTPSGKALPSTARRPVAKRSNSSPASTKAVGPTSKTPLGTNKYPGGKAVGGAQKQITGGVGGAQKAIGEVTGGVGKTVGGVTGGAQRTLGGVSGNAQKTIGGVTGGVGKTVGGVTGGASKTIGGITGGAGKALGGATNTAKKSTPQKTSLPKPFPDKGNAISKGNNLPKPYAPASSYSPAYPSGEKKTAVKPGVPKPFTPPVGGKEADKKPTYPGTNTVVGEGKKTPVRAQKYKPAPRMQGTAEKGKVQHIAV